MARYDTKSAKEGLIGLMFLEEQCFNQCMAKPIIIEEVIIFITLDERFS